MLFEDYLVFLRGGGDLATGAAFRLHRAGFPIIVLELSRPLVVRRRVALAAAVLEGKVTIEGVDGRLVSQLVEAIELAHMGIIPILVAPDFPDWRAEIGRGEKAGSLSSIVIDARMAKRNIDTQIDQGDLVIALGPGFMAGVDCHAVVETKRGHRLGRVLWDGRALPNTGTPGTIGGHGSERVLHASTGGVVEWRLEIGDLVEAGEYLGSVGGTSIYAPFGGVLRGLIAPGTNVVAGIKIGDVDARSDVSACFTISDKSLAIGGGVLEAVLTWLNQKASLGAGR